MGERDHRRFRPGGWVEAGRDKIDAMRAIADRHGLTPLQLAASWNLAHPAVRCVAPTLIQEPGPDATPVEAKRAELAAVPEVSPLSAAEVEEIRALGDNTGCMALKGAAPDYDGPVVADRWPVGAELAAVGARHGVEPAALTQTM
jgi:aryl-alcohol dehydrogenase-like predicted oxidoreductase